MKRMLLRCLSLFLLTSLLAGCVVWPWYDDEGRHGRHHEGRGGWHGEGRERR